MVVGWIALYTEARILGYTFLIIVFSLSISMFVFLILGAVYKHKVKMFLILAGDYATECVGNAVNEYRDSSSSRHIMDAIQDKVDFVWLSLNAVVFLSLMIGRRWIWQSPRVVVNGKCEQRGVPLNPISLTIKDASILSRNRFWPQFLICWLSLDFWPFLWYFKI